MDISDSIKAIKIGNEQFLDQVLNIITYAEKKQIHLRIIGSTAVYLNIKDNPRTLALFNSLGRLAPGSSPFSDLDVITYKKERGKVIDLFEKDLGFVPEQTINAMFGTERNVYHSPDNTYDVDIFYSCLNFSHKICWGDSERDGWLPDKQITIEPGDIVMEKLQIHEINRKDLIDLTLLFINAELSNKKFNYNLLLKHTSEDWGLWYDSMINLDKVLKFSDELRNSGLITEQEHNYVIKNVNTLRDLLEKSEKSKSWLKRAKKGTSIPWYDDVEEIKR